MYVHELQLMLLTVPASCTYVQLQLLWKSLEVAIKPNFSIIMNGNTLPRYLLLIFSQGIRLTFSVTREIFKARMATQQHAARMWLALTKLMLNLKKIVSLKMNLLKKYNNELKHITEISQSRIRLF